MPARPSVPLPATPYSPSSFGYAYSALSLVGAPAIPSQCRRTPHAFGVSTSSAIGQLIGRNRQEASHFSMRRLGTRRKWRSFPVTRMRIDATGGLLPYSDHQRTDWQPVLWDPGTLAAKPYLRLGVPDEAQPVAETTQPARDASSQDASPVNPPRSPGLFNIYHWL